MKYTNRRQMALLLGLRPPCQPTLQTSLLVGAYKMTSFPQSPARDLNETGVAQAESQTSGERYVAAFQLPTQQQHPWDMASILQNRTQYIIMPNDNN